MDIVHINQRDPLYPSALRQYLGDRAPESITALGNLDILKCKTLALFCSIKCPGNLILQTYDLAQNLRQKGVTVISGFHSPMERECLDLLLRGTQPVIVCPARRLTSTRLPTKWTLAINEGRLLLISPFGENVLRVTSDTASVRNDFVAALADRVFVSYAASGSKTEALCRKVIEWGKPLFTFDNRENDAIINLGAKTCADFSNFPLS